MHLGMNIVKLPLEILLDLAKLLDRRTDVGTVDDVYLDTFAYARQLLPAIAVFGGEKIADLVNLYGAREPLGRDLIN